MDVGLVVSAYQAGASLQAVANTFGCSHEHVRQVLIANGIARRPSHRHELHLTTDEMTSLYAKGQSLRAISVKAGASVEGVRYRLRQAGVRMRVTRAAPHMTLKDEEHFLALLDGLLLGDGSLNQGRKARTPVLQVPQTSRRRAWLDWLEIELRSLGLRTRQNRLPPQARYITPSGSRAGGRKEAFALVTPAYAELRTQRARWYEGRRKVIPEDVRLTPLALAQWYWGDGSFVEKRRVKFSTHGFTKTENEFLADSLAAHYTWSPRVGRDGHYWTLILDRKADVQALHNLIRPFEPGCFTYKLS